jgi:hypothetical protein
MALDGVRDAQHDLTTLGSDLGYAEFTVRRTQGDFQRLNGPLETAVADTQTRDVHDAARQLDFILWSARNGLHDSQQGAVRSSGDAHAAASDLLGARKQLEAARGAIDSHDPKVLTLLDEASAALDEASQSALGMTTSINNSAVSLRDADSGLMFADQCVSDIHNDRSGRDVSASAKELRGAVETVKKTLGEMEHTIGAVRGQLSPADAAVARAEQALEHAREALGKG